MVYRIFYGNSQGALVALSWLRHIRDEVCLTLGYKDIAKISTRQYVNA